MRKRARISLNVMAREYKICNENKLILSTAGRYKFAND